MRGKQADVYIRTACFFTVMIPGMERGEPIDLMDKRSIWIRGNNRCLRIQDHIAWREINYSMLQTISADFPGIVIVPMTIVNPLVPKPVSTHIHTDNMKVDDIVEHIAKQSDIPLSPDHRGIMKKQMDRFVTKIRHMRYWRYLARDGEWRTYGN